jgi:SMODS and SLOG-associating 2TM effector domain family 5
VPNAVLERVVLLGRLLGHDMFDCGLCTGFAVLVLRPPTASVARLRARCYRSQMQDHRFGRPPQVVEWTGRQPLSRPAPITPRDKYLADWRLVKRARFNAAKRYERKQSASTIAFALAGIIGFLAPVYALLFKEALSVHSKNVLDFTAFITGALSLVIGLIEQAKDYPAKSRRFDLCGRQVNSVLRRLMATTSVDDEELRSLVDAYEKALEDCGDNHDDIDYEMANAQEEMHQSLGAAKEKATRKLKRLKWFERFQIYWLYVATWATPLLIGLMLWLFAPSD